MHLNEVPFFKAIHYDGGPKTATQWWIEKVDGYFCPCGGKKVVVVSGHLKGYAQEVSLIDTKCDWLIAVAKIISYCTLIFPLIMLVAKALLRSEERVVSSVERETNAARGIQTAYRGHLAKKALKERRLEKQQQKLEKLKENQRELELLQTKTTVVVKIQALYRGRFARQKLRLDKLEREQSRRAAATGIQTVCRRYLAHKELEKRKFTYTVQLTSPNHQDETVTVETVGQERTLLDKIQGMFNHWIAVRMTFLNGNGYVYLSRLQRFEQLAGENLSFEADWTFGKVLIQQKRLKEEQTAKATCRITYKNGTVEERRSIGGGWEGRRIFADGSIEEGFFASHGLRGLNKGYRIEGNGSIEFHNAIPILSCTQPDESEIEIHQVGDRLIVTSRNSKMSRARKQVEEATGLPSPLLKLVAEYLDFSHSLEKPSVIEMPVETALFEVCLRKNAKKYGKKNEIGNILSHPAFAQKKESFIQHVFSTDESGKIRLLSVLSPVAADLIQMAGQDTLKNLPPEAIEGLFLQAATEGCSALLNALTSRFPDHFDKIAPKLVMALLEKGRDIDLVQNVVEQFQDTGKQLDVHCWLCYQAAQVKQPTKSFYKTLDSLSPEGLKKIYEIAFKYRNYYLPEPAISPIQATQYSINLIWINQNKIPENQEFLFGTEDTPKDQECRAHFYKTFVGRISKWEELNPESEINVWVDGKMATPGAIERSQAAVQEGREKNRHLHFRDVRTLKVVQENSDIFVNRPVHFLVDLFRTIIVDEVLKTGKPQYFVYGDFDLEPMAGTTLFDQRSMELLDEYGFVLAKGGFNGYELGMQILNGQHQQFMKSHRILLIEDPIRRLKNQERPFGMYDLYVNMLAHLLDDQNGPYGRLRLAGDGEEEPEGSTREHWFLHRSYDIEVRFEKGTFPTKKIMPVKAVNLPRATATNVGSHWFT